jgi:hypothetical protein
MTTGNPSCEELPAISSLNEILCNDLRTLGARRGTITKDEGDQINRIRDVDVPVAVEIRRIKPARWYRAACEDVLDQKDCVGDVRQTIVVAVAADKLADVTNTVTVSVRLIRVELVSAIVAEIADAVIV